MAEFIFFMHAEAPHARAQDWAAYFAKLRAAGAFEGGSAIGAGSCERKTGAPPPLSTQLSGYIRVSARDLAEARTLLAGNPVYEAGGTVEIRELPHD
ncbi:MAG: hypothetical protein GC190_21690 [Alphaproteobacteria bacterium]|nr:hypothetical protein [Alphaproteobacteria bacterium]